MKGEEVYKVSFVIDVSTTAMESEGESDLEGGKKKILSSSLKSASASVAYFLM